MTPALLVLHDVGDEAGGRDWEAAFLAAGWDGDVVAPDLPGHGDEPAPVGGSYEMGDAALAALRVLRARKIERPVVVGVGANGWAASVLAMAGRSCALVLVDGLGGPWRDPAASIDAGRLWLRAIADDPDAMAPPPARGLDPRLRHGIGRHGDRALALQAAAATTVPVVLVESPMSGVGADDRAAIAAACAGGATVVEVADGAPSTVAPAVVAALGAAASAHP